MEKEKVTQKAVAALSVTKKFAPYQAFALMLVREQFIVKAGTAKGMTTSWRCYTPKEIANDEYKKSAKKIHSLEEKLKNFLEEYSRKSTLLLNI